MITDTGAQAEMFLSLAISAISHAVTPTRLCALSINSDRRAAGLGRSLADLSTLGGMSVGVEGSGRPGVSPACGLVIPSLRPTRVEARRALAALVWHGREQ
jgi:hypothetical protein